MDRPSDLLVAVVDEVVLAEGRVVPAHIDDRRALADTALHDRPPTMDASAPPLMTGRISTETSSATITRTVSGLSSKRWSSACTVIGPSTSTSRFGFRSSTFTRGRLPAYL